MADVTKCPIDECHRPIRKAGMCDTHYANRRRNGLLPPIQPTACESCGAVILPTTRKPRRFCSDQCLRSHWNPVFHQADAEARRSARSGRTCARCGRSFDPSTARARHCSKQCGKAAMSAFHRAKKADPQAEKFDYIEIFERDGWICRLCGEPVDRTLIGRHVAAGPSIDHIVPLTRGGLHVRANVQLAHLRCNAAKGNRQVG